jgi:AraC-like DNA-binding protein
LATEVAVLGAVDGLRPHLRPGPPARRGGAEHAAVRRARAYLADRWANPVSLSELSAVAGLSRFELVRRFRSDVGLPPHTFQLDLRIKRARGMLAAGQTPAAVAAACGFADQAHLTRTFKRFVGVTPTRFALA